MRSLPVRAVMALCVAAAARAETLKVPATFPTVQEAVNAAGVGDVIVIAAGTYAENVLVDGKSNLELRGSGKVFLDGGTTGPALAATGSVDLRLVNLRFVNGDVACLSLADCTGVSVVKCRTVNADDDGVTLTGCTDVTLLKCRVEESERHGILVSDSAGVVLVACRVRATGDDGLHLEALADPDALRAEKCLIQETQGDGIELLNATFVELSGCRVLDCGVVGIRANFVTAATETRVSVLDCRVERTGAGEPALSLEGNANLVERTKVRDAHLGLFGGSGFSAARDCDLRGMETKAIHVVDSDGLDIRGNVIRDAGQGIEVEFGSGDVTENDIRLTTGIAISVQSFSVAVSVTDNIVRNCLDGIRLLTADDIVISGNELRKAGFAISAFASGSGHSITGNMISKCTVGVHLLASGSTIADNVMQGLTQDGVFLSAANCEVTGNTVSKAGRHGFNLDGVADSTLTSNVSKKAGEVGFRLSENTVGNILSLNVGSGSGTFDLQDEGRNTIQPDNVFGTIAP